MATTLSKGYKLPATGEKGYFTSLETNINLVNAHTHNGTDGFNISSQNITKPTSAVSHLNWAAVSGQAGTYRQTITVPAGVLVKNSIPKFYINGTAADGNALELSVNYLTATTFDVFINDNTLDLTVIYG